MKDIIYNVWMVLRLILSAVSLSLSIMAGYVLYDTGRIEMFLFCVVGLIFSINLIVTK